MKIDYTKYIHSDPKVLLGKPVIKGTRISVELILEKLAVGETIEQIIESYPRITCKAINASLIFASKILRQDVIYPVSA